VQYEPAALAVQEFNMSVVLLISGKQGSGKTTLAKGLVSRFENERKTFHLKFADILYEMHDEVCRVAYKYGIPTSKKESRLLQLLGTEWGRETKGQDVWVNALANKIANIHGTIARDDLVVVDDCRFPNELAMRVSGWMVLSCRLEATKEARKSRAEGWRDTDDHPSETALDDLGPSSYNLTFNTDTVGQGELLDCVASYLDAVLSAERDYNVG